MWQKWEKRIQQRKGEKGQNMAKKWENKSKKQKLAKAVANLGFKSCKGGKMTEKCNGNKNNG